MTRPFDPIKFDPSSYVEDFYKQMFSTTALPGPENARGESWLSLLPDTIGKQEGGVGQDRGSAAPGWEWGTSLADAMQGYNYATGNTAGLMGNAAQNYTGTGVPGNWDIMGALQSAVPGTIGGLVGGGIPGAVMGGLGGLGGNLVGQLGQNALDWTGLSQYASPNTSYALEELGLSHQAAAAVMAAINMGLSFTGIPFANTALAAADLAANVALGKNVSNQWANVLTSPLAMIPFIGPMAQRAAAPPIGALLNYGWESIFGPSPTTNISRADLDLGKAMAANAAAEVGSWGETGFGSMGNVGNPDIGDFEVGSWGDVGDSGVGWSGDWGEEGGFGEWGGDGGGDGGGK